MKILKSIKVMGVVFLLGLILLLASCGESSKTVVFKDYDGAVLKEELVEHGKSAIAPKDPIRKGYSFIGWDVEFSKVESNLEVVALYEINSYEVVFKDSEGTLIKTDIVDYGKRAITPEAPIKEGYTFIGWYYGLEEFDKKFTNQDIITNDVVIYAIYEEIITYIVDFITNTNIEVDSQVIEIGNKVKRPADPIKEGYTFKGWYINNDELWVFGGYLVTEDIVLKAKWEANEYKITFNSNGGLLEYYEINVTYDKHIILPVPELEDNYFMGWLYNDELIENGIWNIADNITLDAYFIQKYYEVYYDLGYENNTNQEMVSYGEEFIPYNPERTGYTFDGWFDQDDNLFTGFNIWKLESDLNLLAKWTVNTYMVDLDLNDGEYVGELEYMLTYGENYSLPVPTSNEGSFNGWYYNDTKLTDKEGNSINPYLFTEDITLVAIYYFEVSTKEDLLNINNDLEATYRLVNDINISSLEWEPVGTLENPFKGKLEGTGFTIIGLTITKPHDYLGLIGYNEGLIKEINLSEININVTGNIQQRIYAGSLIGFNKGEIYDIKTLSGEINLKVRGGANGYLGGVIGYSETPNDYLLSNIENNVNVTGDLSTYTGGIIGYSMNKRILDNFVNKGKVYSNNDSVGGLIGSGDPSTITNSYNSGEVSSYSGFVGGLIGKGSSTITNSYNSGEVSGFYSVGGLIGEGSSTITNSYNSGEVSGGDSVGGLVGYGSSTITNSYNSGEVSGGIVRGEVLGSSVGGLVGYGSSTITNSYNSGEVSGFYSVGGLIGEGSSVYIYYSINFGKIVASSYTQEIGGLIGDKIVQKDIEHGYYTGNIIVNEIEVEGIDFGLKIDGNNIDEEFFLETLIWNEEIWNLTNVDIINQIYPKLKNN